jgi:hypothetical protein
MTILSNIEVECAVIRSYNVIFKSDNGTKKNIIIKKKEILHKDSTKTTTFHTDKETAGLLTKDELTFIMNLLQ